MFQLDLKNRKSIYEQIVDGFKDMIVKGELATGEKLPSVRDLSAKLTVNPNTIQKAYSKLEADGWVYMVSGRGVFVSGERRGPDRQQLEAIYAQIGALLTQLIFLGESHGEMAARLTQMTEERKGDK